MLLYVLYLTLICIGEYSAQMIYFCPGGGNIVKKFTLYTFLGEQEFKICTFLGEKVSTFALFGIKFPPVIFPKKNQHFPKYSPMLIRSGGGGKLAPKLQYTGKKYHIIYK